MPMTAALLKPGVNTQYTFALNEAGVSQSQLIRYKDGLIQTYGGWTQFVNFTVPSTVRDLHAWQSESGVKRLGIGATANLAVITAGSNQDITPQTATTNSVINFGVSSGSNVVTVIDANGTNLPSIFNTIFFDTPVALGNLLLNGAYPIVSVLGANSFTISATGVSCTTVGTGAVGSTGSSGLLPIFRSTNFSAAVTVDLPNNNFIKAPGIFYSFYAPTTVVASGATYDAFNVQGPYQLTSIVDSTRFTITNTLQTSVTAGPITMNTSLVQLVYYVTIGPQPSGSGFGAGQFGGGPAAPTGGFGTGTSFTGTAGTPITTTDWSLDNWGEVLLACPKDGAIYIWSANQGTTNAQVISQAPFFNGGIFVSMPQQILVAWKSTLFTGTQDNLVVRWCDAEDFTNWTVSNQTTAGSFHIPTGSVIVGGMQGPSQGVIWTDVDVWAMQYIGGDLIFNFTRIGAGCGLIGQHAANTLSGNIYWMGVNNFFVLSGDGVNRIPCPVWDFVFQNLSQANVSKIRCTTNSSFNEVTWFFPSAASAGENDSYVKLNITEQAWDFGLMARTAWVDVSVLGQPIGASPDGTIYQHETGNTNFGASVPSFRSGWWAITEGNDFATVDFVMPDFQWGTYSGAKTTPISLTFFSVDYPGDAPRVQGPFTVTQATEFITPRLRGRLMAMQVDGNGTTFWRTGKVRYRYTIDGRR